MYILLHPWNLRSSNVVLIIVEQEAQLPFDVINDGIDRYFSVWGRDAWSLYVVNPDAVDAFLVLHGVVFCTFG